MAIAEEIKKSIEGSSAIRKMFEEGIKMKAQFGDDNVFDFSLGNPDLEPPEIFFSTVKKFMENPTPRAHGYMPNPGFPQVRAAIAAKVVQESGVPVTANAIVMSSGAAGGINVLLKTLLNPGDEVIIIKPFFAEYMFYIKNYNGAPVLVDTNPDFSINIGNIEKAITPKTKALIINSPNNPSGKIYSQDDINALAAVLKKASNPIYLISDEPYKTIVYDGKKVPSVLASYENAIAITSYSKAMSLPGERIGFVAVNPAAADFDMIIDGLVFCTRVLGFVNAPALMQRVVAELPNTTVDVSIYKKKRDLLVKGLGDAGYDFLVPEGAFYFFCKAPGGNDIAYVDHLKKYNVLAVPGTGFGGPGYFRLAFCVPEKTIVDALPKFKQAIGEFK
jgi:aspartate aminotransferase